MVWDKPKDEPLTEFDRRLIGYSKRVTIPLENSALMKEVLDSLRRLCSDLQNGIDMQNMSERQRILQYRGAISTCSQSIRYKAKAYGVHIREGRPTNIERQREAGLIRLPKKLQNTR